MIPQRDYKHVLQGAGGIFFVVIVVLVATHLWTHSYKGHMPPNTSIAGVDVSKLSVEQARRNVQDNIDKIITQGLVVATADEPEQKQLLPLGTLVSTDFQEDVFFDLEGAIEAAQIPQGDALAHSFHIIKRLVSETHVPLTVRFVEQHILDNLADIFPQTQSPPVNARLDYILKTDGWHARILPGSPGVVIDASGVFDTLSTHLSTLDTSVAILPIRRSTPDVEEQDLKPLQRQAVALIENTPYTLAAELDDNTREWSLGAWQLVSLLDTQRENSDMVTFVVNDEAFATFVDPLVQQINIEPKNARFQIDGNRVTEFQSSTPGRELDTETLQAELIETLIAGETTIPLAILETHPTVSTSDVNNLGIREELGSGFSRYRGSPANRIHNIRNGVKLLDGLLIPPGETFSLIDALKPFTAANGYLPELVIKGDRIEPELGGGLCQIGTTAFRATMNAGLHVAERRNHSLVVSYYNDLANGNPGTDATLYEPVPDYKFTNDTENYVLFQAEMLPWSQDLKFTLWGTSDGREGSYSAPVVHRWIPVGEDRVIESDDIEPGEETCQNPHAGADTSFIYSVKRADGSVDETTFESHYRPLPKICLVPKQPEEEKESEITDTEESDSSSEADLSTQEVVKESETI